MSLQRKNFTLGVILVWLNLVDALFTIYFIKYRQAVEMNPVMAFLIERGFGTFFVIKMAVVIASTTFVVTRPSIYRRSAYRLLLICVILYSMLDLYHICGYFGLFNGFYPR